MISTVSPIRQAQDYAVTVFVLHFGSNISGWRAEPTCPAAAFEAKAEAWLWIVPDFALRLRRGSLHFPFHSKRRLVGTRGFEPPAPASRTRCSTRLSHVPIRYVHISYSLFSGKYLFQYIILIKCFMIFAVAPHIVTSPCLYAGPLYVKVSNSMDFGCLSEFSLKKVLRGTSIILSTSS